MKTKDLSKLESELSKLESSLSAAPLWIDLGNGNYIAASAVATLEDNGHSTRVNGELETTAKASEILACITAKVVQP